MITKSYIKVEVPNIYDALIWMDKNKINDWHLHNTSKKSCELEINCIYYMPDKNPSWLFVWPKSQEQTAILFKLLFAT